MIGKRGKVKPRPSDERAGAAGFSASTTSWSLGCQPAAFAETQFTVTVMVPRFESTLPSKAAKVNVSVPLKPVAGR